jgi:hypothetical protein
MSYAAPIELVQAALTRVGGQMITSLEDGSMPATIAKANYEGLAKRRLSMHTWSFASYPVKLVFQGERDTGMYRFAYMIPPEALRVHSVNVLAQRVRQYKLDNGKVLFPSAYDYEAMISHRAPESTWPADFAEAFIVELEALFLSSLVRNPQDARLRQRDAEVLFRTALAADKRQAPGPPAMTDGTLARAWRGV